MLQLDCDMGRHETKLHFAVCAAVFGKLELCKKGCIDATVKKGVPF